MRSPTWLLLLSLTAFPLWAKPKVDVRVTLNDGIGKDVVQDSLAKNGDPLSADSIGGHGTNMIYGRVFYLNVTMFSHDAAAVAKNNGQWCITGDSELEPFVSYQGTLQGNSLVLEIPQKNGKIKKKNFEIYDHQWRNLAALAP